jgi:SAM-dependent methyltransferase
MTAAGEPAAAASIEDVKAYWNARPCNIRHSPAPVGSREYFDQVEARKYVVEPHIPRFAAFDRWAGKRVLEIGCGIGTDAVNFARAGADYTGVELSAESLAIARQRFEVFGLAGTLIEADAESLADALPGERFDLVYSFGVLHHTPDPARAFAQIRQLIKPDGELRIMLYARHSWKASMIAAGLDQPEAQWGCPIANTYSRDEVVDLLDGFDVVSIEQDHIFPYKVADYKEYRYVKEDWFAAMPDEVFRALETQLGWHMLIKARPRG